MLKKAADMPRPAQHADRGGEGLLPVFIYTDEGAGVDRYSQEIARRMPVHSICSGRYGSGLHTYGLLKKLGKSRHMVHLPNQHFGRYALLAGIDYIVTVHDLARICFPFDRESLSEKVGLGLDVIAIGRAKHIIAVSQSTRRDLVKHLGVPKERTTVIYNGVDRSVFKPRPAAPFPFPYILYVGSERPRKNLGRLLAAFAALKRSEEFRPLKLVKVGRAGRSLQFRQDTLRVIRDLGLGGEVIFAEHVTDRDLASYYSAASALVYPSLYEGFGLPLVEAMACHCPVIASNVSSLSEVAGDAAMLVAPHDVAGWVQGLTRMLTDGDLRGRLIAAGQVRARRFSWDEAAAATLAVYQGVKELWSYPRDWSVPEARPLWGRSDMASWPEAGA